VQDVRHLVPQVLDLLPGGWHVKFECEFELEVKFGKHEFNEKCEFEAKWKTRTRACVNKRVVTRRERKNQGKVPGVLRSAGRLGGLFA